jgi:CO/xanthine dehydrogenase Mo-binding subunit
MLKENNPSEKSKGVGQTSRRDFLKITGSGMGLLVIASVAGPFTLPAKAFQGGPPPFPKDLNAYLHVHPNGRVTCMVGKVELGAGEMTSLAQCLAEELDVSYDSVDMVMGDTELCPWDMGTFGSLCFNLYHTVLRGAAAEARSVLLLMASEQMRVPVEKLQVENGRISVIGSPKDGITYAELVKDKRIERHIEKVPLKDPQKHKLIGTSPVRKDALAKVTGKAHYAADVGLPGTVYARVVRPPAFGATLKSIDTSAAEKFGAKIVRDGDFIVVIHEKFDGVNKALSLVKADWARENTGIDDETIYAHLQTFAPKLAVIKEQGSLAEGEKLVAANMGGMIERSYYNAYCYHSPIETHSVVGQMENGKLTIYASTQFPFGEQEGICKSLDMKPENVRIIATYVGGAFGGKSNSFQACLEIAKIAKLAPGKPIMCVWDRAEDMYFTQHRPAAFIKIRSGLTKEGMLGYYEYNVFGAGQWGADTNYDIPNQKTSFVGSWAPFEPSPKGMQPLQVGPWRAPACNSNTFANECQIDEMAHLAGADPAEFRLKHLVTDKRQKRVLESAMKQFGYKPGTKLPAGQGIGVATGKLYNTYAAAIVQVAVDSKTGAVHVIRVVDAVDAGSIVNPVGASMQVEGCITMGIGSALTEEIHFKDGEVLDHNFDSYEIPHFSSIPKMEVVLVENREMPPLGIGEPPIVVIGPAIANAIFNAVGARVRHLPMTPTRVKAAMAKA